MKFEGILLVSDMDGTLLNSKRQISDENIRAIERFVNEGGLFTVATGRMELGVRQFLDLLPVNAPAILYNGAVIYDFKREETLWQDYLKQEVEEAVRDVMLNYPEVGIEVFQGGDVYFLRQNCDTDEHVLREKFTPHVIPIEQIPRPWYKVILAGDSHVLESINTYLSRKETTFRTVYSEPRFLELLDRNTSKGNALKMLTEMLGCSRENVIAVGDNLNDLEMIKEAGTGIAVENAHQELKCNADFCSCDHNNHVILKVIGWIEKRSK